MLSTNIECYVCSEPVLEDDVPVYKDIEDNDILRMRHFWHIAPNHDFIQGMLRYATTLTTARTWAIEKLADPYKAPEQKELFQIMLDEANRLIAKHSHTPIVEPGLHSE